MAKAIEQLPSGLIVGHAQLGQHGTGVGSVAQQVHDGDTVTVEAVGNLGVRFLSVDGPEVSVPLPGTTKPFVPLSDQRWQAVLAKPFAADLPDFTAPLQAPLRDHLTEVTGEDAATVHADLAEAATKELEDLVAGDLAQLGQTKETFRFFLAFAAEVMDRYGRQLCYLHPAQPQTPAADRLLSYNERMLQAGWVMPYFIWPNLNPFRKAAAVVAAVPAPGNAADIAQSESSLRRARQWVQQARHDGRGLYAAPGPLKLQPFELRYLSRRQPPDRWVVDMNRDDDLLLPPQTYFSIPNPEDRLFVPAEYVPLWEANGWRRGT